MVAFLEKSTGSAGFHQIIDFITRSVTFTMHSLRSQRYVYPLSNNFRGLLRLLLMIMAKSRSMQTNDGQRTVDTNVLSRRFFKRDILKLADQDGVTSIPTTELFEQLELMGYHTDSDNPKKTAWEQFSSNIAAAVICLATNRKFNFSRMIFEHMVSNISSPHKFLMYPSNNEEASLRDFHARRLLLFPTMLEYTAPTNLQPSRITSSPSPTPSPSPEPSPTQPSPTPSQSPTQLSPTQPSPPQPSPTQPSQNTLLDSEHQLPPLSEQEWSFRADLLKDKEKLTISAIPKAYSQESEAREVTPTESFIKSKRAVWESNDEVITVENCYIFKKQWAAKRNRQDKGISIMIDEEPKKKSKKELEQERLSYAEAIRLEEQMNEEQKAQIARDEKIAFDRWRVEKKVSKNQQQRERTIPRKSTRKRQKLEEDAEKDELKGFLDIVPREEAPIEVESISTKFPSVDWKTYVLTKTFMYYQVFRGDGSSKNYKVLSEMLEDFDRLDVEELYRLVKNRYSASSPEGFDLMLWGDLHTLFEPDEEDEIWKDQHEYNLLSWRLCDFYGIHILLMDNGLAMGGAGIMVRTERRMSLALSQKMFDKDVN
ncbi:hypothetical protein Tco_1123380 [Tanacetum coccineum]|uniref:Uncharacterized protein n=1 Tax=Tanacetum coccineum TaxID=301880 RepID=A0ABQ5J4V1_9ASTR